MNTMWTGRQVMRALFPAPVAYYFISDHYLIRIVLLGVTLLVLGGYRLPNSVLFA